MCERPSTADGSNVSGTKRLYRRGSCVAFTRSIHVCGTGVGNRPREQYNENTAFIDGSSVYSVAADLQNMNRHWSQDRVFQESRKIVGSVMQVKCQYQPDVFLMQEGYPLLGPNFEDRGQISFLSGVGRIEQVLTAIDALYRGLIATPARSPQRITTSVTERLFGGMDMATLNIQRGRDHGLRSYNDYRKLCQLQPITNFNQWPEVTDRAVRERVSQLYRTPDDIDLYVGGTLEEPIEGSLVGPTFACIIAEQFVRLRDGDRSVHFAEGQFYFENQGVFTPAQVAALKAVTFSWVLCETGDSMTRIVPNAFNIDRGQNAVPCASLRRLDLSPWKE
ncbi:animal hem peroxidase [Ancylostoma ceylanicum]|uniref:Animal hem peroxidase n=1 Tax=Ancylostoma ceylanicum TaxID=53326 RepID=A0A0D6LXW2_9BILA|nr:animal hem peroxidase [Ancylostoma ceylanicum]